MCPSLCNKEAAMTKITCIPCIVGDKARILTTLPVDLTYSRRRRRRRTLGSKWILIDCTQQDGCTCSAASIQGVSCDVCETCTKFRPSEIASWTTTPWMVPNVHLSCPADNIYGISQACPTRILPAGRPRDLGWFTGGVLFGGVIGAATAYWFYRQKKNQTALLLEPSSNGKEESNYNIHDGGVVGVVA